jgi:hypothetical protein
MSNKFNEIFLKAKTISEKSQNGYRVYTDKDNFQMIPAQTVAEAIEKSGIKSPFKIEPAGVITKSIFTQAELAEKQVSQTSQPAPANPA